MSVSRRDAARSAAVAGIAAFLVFLPLVAYAPDSVPYSPNNYGWNGIEGISSTYKVVFADSLSSLPTGKTVLVELQPTSSFSSADVKEVSRYVSGGGTLLVADSSGYANGLLEGLGTGIVIEDNLTVNDPIYNWKAQQLPIALVVPGMSSEFPFLRGVQELALDEPSPLDIPLDDNRSIAITSPVSFDVSRAAQQSVIPVLGGAPPAISKGQFVLAAAERIGEGTVIVVGDSEFLTNSGWDVADNGLILGNLFGNSTVVIDASHWTTGPLTSSTAELKGSFGQVYRAISGSPARYILTAGLVAASVALVPSFAGQAKRPQKTEEDLTSLNKQVLLRVRKDRERYAGKPE